MTRNFLEEIKELCSPNVYIKNKQLVNNLISTIIEGGTSKLQIVSDFDRTITKQHDNGKVHLSSFGMFSECKSLPKEYFDTAKALTDKYLPIENDPKIPPEEKRKYMEEWWSLSEKALTGIRITRNEIENVIVEVAPSLRDGTRELFYDLNKADVPVLVFSAGLGDCVVAVLKHFDVLFPNVKVISNFLKIENDIIQGFDGDVIHVLNKNEYALKDTKYYDLVQERGNVILLGDHTGDAKMAEGVPHQNAVLKIGFLYGHVDMSLPSYMENFDIVLVDDQTMNVVRAILSFVL